MESRVHMRGAVQSMRVLLLMLCYVLVLSQDVRLSQSRGLEETDVLMSLLIEKNITLPVTTSAYSSIELFWFLWHT